MYNLRYSGLVTGKEETIPLVRRDTDGNLTGRQEEVEQVLAGELQGTLGQTSVQHIGAHSLVVVEEGTLLVKT